MNLSLVKWVGGKFYLKKWLYEHFQTPHDIFVDATGGAGTVIINKTPSKMDVLNDIDPVLFNLYYHIKFNAHLPLLIDDIQCSENVFKHYQRVYYNFKEDGSYTEQLAVATIVVRRMSRGGLGKDYSHSKRLRGGRIEEENSWENFKLKLPSIVERFKSIWVRNQHIIRLIPEIDSQNTLIYIDPPYYPSTVKSKTYDYVWTETQHEDFLDIVQNCLSKVAISGYMCPLYKEKLKGWNLSVKDIACHASQSKKKGRRQECLWTNYQFG